jgi:Xaa-Pro aminopeptidase
MWAKPNPRKINPSSTSRRKVNAMETFSSPHSLRVAAVRAALQRHQLAAVLVPSSDPHLSEYLPEHWQGRQWLSGFTGSMGLLVIGLEAAALFADSRYWVQAETELQGSGIVLMKTGAADSVHHVDWLIEQITRQPSTQPSTQSQIVSTHCVGIDGRIMGLTSAQQLQAKLAKAGVQLRTDFDVLAQVWPDRPALPSAPVFEHSVPHASTTRASKLAQVRTALVQQGATHHFISTLDDIAWLLNLRGADVSFNPVFLSHLLLDAHRATLFIGEHKVPPELQAVLAQDGVHLAPYEAAAATLSSLVHPARLLIDPKRITWGTHHAVKVPVIEAINPSTLLKSCKTLAEAEHVRAAMAQDGAAMCEFYAWFEAALAERANPASQLQPITELTVDEHLSAARARRVGFMGLSFNTIAAFNANGAMPHYHATPDSHAVIEGNGLLLIDSGGQYLGGTTDITRVWPIGSVTAAQKRDYTLVLKGTLALSRTRFPRGTPGPMLDAMARAPLWEHGLDFGHGTGHGVGYFLNVHEGPQSISKTMPDANMAMQPGMITSIEPGLYRPGRWGIRIENLALTVPAQLDTNSPDAHEFGDDFGEFLEFETLSLCPIDTRCIDHTLLRADEVEWLNAYHRTVRERLKPLLRNEALAWLMLRTEALLALG